MKFVFAFAGLDNEVYDDFYKNKFVIAGPTSTVISKPWDPAKTSGHAVHAYSQYFINELHKIVLTQNMDDCAQTGIAVVYIDRPDLGGGCFGKMFHPFAITLPIKWELNRSPGQPMAQSKNALMVELREGALQLREAIPLIRDEVMQRSNKTPLLLPNRNFKSGVLTKALELLEQTLPNSVDKRKTLQAAMKTIENLHPASQKFDEKGRRITYFEDDKKIEFRAPGNARHGMAHGGLDHIPQCLLAGRKRLGAPYDWKFHYDCVYGKGKWTGSFFSCHHDHKHNHNISKHINIAPNNYVR